MTPNEHSQKDTEPFNILGVFFSSFSHASSIFFGVFVVYVYMCLQKNAYQSKKGQRKRKKSEKRENLNSTSK